MAFRTWVKLLGTVVGVAALAGASQLGIAYGLGIVRLTRVLGDAARDQWTAQLAWVAWLAMTAAVLGGLTGGRLRDGLRGPATVGTHIAVAVAAGAGAAIVVPLTMQPARTAQIAGVHPVFVIGLCAAFGALVGAFAAYAVLAHVVARWSVSVVGIAIWTIAIVSVLPSLGPGAPLPAVRLGVFDAGFLSPAVTQRTALFTMPALALLVGATHGWTARRREMPTLTIALAGLPGPALLTVAYLIAGPGSGADRYQIVPYWAAMTATGAGVLGSVLAAVIGRSDGPAESAGDEDAASAQASPSASPLASPSASPLESPPASSPVDDTAAVLPATPPGGRRSSAADAFLGRSAEWPVRRPETTGAGDVAVSEYAEPEPFDAFAATSRTPTTPEAFEPHSPDLGRHGSSRFPSSDLEASILGLSSPEPSGMGATTLGGSSPEPGNLPSSSLGPSSWEPNGAGANTLGPSSLTPSDLDPPDPHLSGPVGDPLQSTPIEESPARTGGLLSRMPFGRGRGRALQETPAAPPRPWQCACALFSRPLR